MPIILNGITFNNGGSVTLNGQTVKEIKFNTTTVWKAETVLYDGTTLLSGYTLTKGNNANVNGLWYARPRYNDTGGWASQGYAVVSFNASNFNSISITYSVNCGTYGWAGVGIRSSSGFGKDFLYTCALKEASGDSAGGTASGTATFDISNRTGTLYIGCQAYNTQGNTTDAVITRVVLS